MNHKVTLQLTLNQLGIELSAAQQDQLLQYLSLLEKWNGIYNLSAVRDIDSMLKLHLIDCLAVMPFFGLEIKKFKQKGVQKKVRIMDVGSGAGLPGIILSIVFPAVDVICVDAVAKKIAFLRQVASELKLLNLTPIHARVESLKDEFQIITSRAFSSLKDLIVLTQTQLTNDGLWMAMKGKEPKEEILQLPLNTEVFHVEHIEVPMLEADRCLIFIKKVDSCSL